ncbi:FKBP-type peptidyl-prolyl cis-trans isomerase N-terminal domain-containing protein [Chryseobacterium arachidis]|uniref:FKBP-type peptidyl-prolyl cis-trans isomerase N-terminal domain-containing protein n=1 Tax=Chryseobacterium arachidis TaxID=1416778 RepID=UPI0036206321
MKRQGFPADPELLAQAIKDGLTDKPTLFPKEEMGSFLQGFMQKQNEKKQAEAKVKAEENKKKSADFLAKNKLNKNIKTTASGLQYEVLKEGDGKKQTRCNQYRKRIVHRKTNGRNCFRFYR